MKIIVLIPIKNEAWILESALKNIAPHVDYVIIADQNSSDNSIEICKKFPNVRIISNPNTEHSNKVRWLLLEEARKIAQESLVICIDADEMISPEGIREMKRLALEGKAVKGDVFKLQWIQLWNDLDEYRHDGVWKDNFKNVAFIDNEGVNEYRKKYVINDHTSRVPDTKINKEITLSYPLLHLHFVMRERTQLKQAWYRCSELIKGLRNAKRINNTYRVTLIPKQIDVSPTKGEWVSGLTMPKSLGSIVDNWHLKEILVFFDTYGISFFEPLQIWHIRELHEEFIKRVGRDPHSKTYPKWMVALNDIKNKIKNLI